MALDTNPVGTHSQQRSDPGYQAFAAWLVAAWLVGIIVDFVSTGGYYDIALRDFGLLIGAVALARLALEYRHATAAA